MITGAAEGRDFIAMADFELRSDRAVLRDFIAEDEPSFIEWASEDTLYKYMTWRLADPADAQAEFQRLLQRGDRLAHCSPPIEPAPRQTV